MFEIIGEIVIDLMLIVVAKWKIDERVEYFERRRSKPTYFAYIGIAVVAALLAFLLRTVVPQRLLPESAVPGISLIVSPFTAGLIMRAYGNRQRNHGRETTVLATFWGGALFAFIAALVRWLKVA